MIVPEEITTDLKEGLSIDAALKKQGTNLKELFPKGKHTLGNSQKPKYYYYDKSQDRFIVQKRVKGKLIHFGSYPCEWAAQYAVKLLMECGWNSEDNWRVRAEVNEYIKIMEDAL